MAKYKVLSTKKLEPSLVEKAKQHDIEIVEQDFISVNPIWSEETFKEIIGLAEAGKQHAVFTSSNAVTAVDRYLYGDTYRVIDWKTYCLSGRTKEAIFNARHLEKNIVAEADNATALAQKIIESGVTEVVYFCGNKRREELPTILKNAGVTVHEVVVYETIETPTIATTEIDAVLFFSPSAVQSFFSVNQLNDNTVCFAIGQTTADSVKDFSNNKIIAPESPSQEMMLASVNFFFQNKSGFDR